MRDRPPGAGDVDNSYQQQHLCEATLPSSRLLALVKATLAGPTGRSNAGPDAPGGGPVSTVTLTEDPVGPPAPPQVIQA